MSKQQQQHKQETVERLDARERGVVSSIARKKLYAHHWRHTSLTRFVIRVHSRYMYIHVYIHVCVLCTNRGSRQSVDCPTQTVDLRFAQTIHGLFQAQCTVREKRLS